MNDETITLPRSVVERALKALDEIAWSNDTRWQSDCADSVRLKLRAALEQPPVVEQEPVAVVSVSIDGPRTTVDLDWNDRLSELPAGNHRLYTHPQPRQPLTEEQEPYCFASLNKQGDVTSVVKRRDGWRKTPLYLHPQPRQPMTPEMADLGWELHGSSDAYQAWSLAVEWTERTHGIGVEE